MKRGKYILVVILVLALLAGVLFAILQNVDVVHAEEKSVSIGSLDYVGRDYYMYSSLKFYYDGGYSNDGTIYTNSNTFKIKWERGSTNFSSMHNMSIVSCNMVIWYNSVPIQTYSTKVKYATTLGTETIYETFNAGEGIYKISWNAEYESWGTTVKPSGSKTIIVDKTAPSGTLSGVNSNGYANDRVTFSWNDASSLSAPIKATLDGSSYTKGAAVTSAGKHTIVLSDAAGNSSKYTFTIDKTRPIGTLNGVTNGGITNTDVRFMWDDSSAIATLNGTAYGNGTTISSSGDYKIVLIDLAGNASTYTFTIDKISPTGTLIGVTNGGITNTNVSFSWDDTSASATLDGVSYGKGEQISDEGVRKIVLKDLAGNVTTYTFTIDKTTPTGALSGVTNGGKTSSDVRLRWDDSSATATLNGVNYNNNSTVSSSGNHTIVLRDLAGNISTYTFTIDKIRPYINNLDVIASQFNLDSSTINKLCNGQLGNVDLTLVWGLPGIEFSFADSLTSLKVNIRESLYVYNKSKGTYSIQGAREYSGSSSFKLIKSGEYVVTVTDELGNELKLNFKIGADIAFVAGSFVLKGDRYILAKDIETQIIAFNNLSNDMQIKVDGVNVGQNNLTLARLKELLASKSEREKSGQVTITSNYNGIEHIYFDAYIGYDFSHADIHNLSSIDFDSGSGSYLGTAKPGIRFDFGALPTELDETAALVQTLYAYDSRNVLYVKAEQTVAYTSGLVIANDGYYVLRINDGARITEYSFKIMAEFKSANEYMLKNEYFIAPEYNAVKLPLSFGTFTISHHENIADIYIGKYSAEKQYLFSADTDTAQAFAFAAEYSVCVQKTATGYLYRARNQGIQVAYNSFEQLSVKIREVVKEYITYKSTKLGDNQAINYASQVIMDESLKYNGRYENVAPQTIGGNMYDKIMLVNKSFVFKYNHGRDALSGQAKITLTNIETGASYNVLNNTILSDYTELNGLYLVEENCPGSSVVISYYIYLDNVAPTADIMSHKADGVETEQTVTAADTIVLQVARFNLKSVTDIIDNYCLVYITGYGFSDAKPVHKGSLANITLSAELGHKGAYTIEIYDRSKNKFSFTVYVMGAAPEATFTRTGSGDTEHVILNISTPDRYCTVMELSIYRNKTDNNSGQLTVDSDNNAISPAVLSYVFAQGGRYTVVIVDNFARTTEIELRYIKDMPNIAVDGLNKERRVNKDITVTLPLNCLYTITTAKSSTITCDTMTDTSTGIIVIVIRPRNEYNELVYLEDKVTIKAWYEADPDAYNDLSYMLDTIAPTLELVNEGGEIAQGALHKVPVKLSYDSDVKTIDVTRNGRYFYYVAGQVIRLDGEYSATATDTAGNVAIKDFVVDSTVDYIVTYENNKKYLSSYESNVTVARGFVITPNEQVAVTATKDGYVFDYNFADRVMAPGLYVLELVDNAGNMITIKIRVIASIEGIALRDEDGELLSYNALTKKSVYLDWNDLSYIKEVAYRQGSAISTYTKGERLTKSGTHLLTFTDVVDNTLEVIVKIDKEVDLSINFDKQYPLGAIDSIPNTLTKRFNVTHNESNINMTIKRDGVEIAYALGMWLTANGLYELAANDEAGNELKQYITVIGETAASISITTTSGINVLDKGVYNQNVTLSWQDKDYISHVDVNYQPIANGATLDKDGRYTLNIVDLLDRTITLSFTIKSKINFEMTYVGSHSIMDGGEQVVLTRGFKLSTSDNLTITATLNGEQINIVPYRQYVEPGKYRLMLIDDAQNALEINIQVVDKVFLPQIMDINGKTIENNAKINTAFSVQMSEFVASVIVNGEKYTSGNSISKEGRNTIEVVDILGATATLNITIDTKVDYVVTYGKTHDKLSHMLTDKFLVMLNENISVNMTLNGIEITFGNKYYISSGIYNVVLRDEIGNQSVLVVEVDNRTPSVQITDGKGNVIDDNITNMSINIAWSAEQNIDSVRVNGVLVDNGVSFATVGQYQVQITNHLGVVAERVITIKHDVEYQIAFRLGHHEYQVDGSNWILTAGFTINGNSIVSISCERDGAPYAIETGRAYSGAGIYIIKLIDDANNEVVLRIKVSDIAISGTVHIDGVQYGADTATNKNFYINQNAFVDAVNINGTSYSFGTVIDTVGRHEIEYIDVLGRKSYQTITIDRTMDIEWQYKKVNNIDGRDIYLNTKLDLNAKEPMTFTVKLDGELIEDFDPTKVYLDSGLYEILATDAVGNFVTIFVLVDNLAPIFEASEPDEHNRVVVKITDSTSIEVTVYLNGELTDLNGTELLLDKHGNYSITATDELGNSAELKVNTDIKVEVSYNFLMGQSINFRPQFALNETLNYELTYDGAVVEYKINSTIEEVGAYSIRFIDERGNSITVNFDYRGSSRKLAKTNYMLPTIEGLQYKVFFEQQPIDVVEQDGYIVLDKTGVYELIFTIEGKETSYMLEIVNTPPTITIGGKFKGEDDLRAYGQVNISVSSEYQVYYNGELIKSPSAVDKVGKYRVVATDSVGNTKEFEFEIYYRMNGFSVLLIVIIVTIMVLIVFFILKKKGILKIKIKTNKSN